MNNREKMKQAFAVLHTERDYTGEIYKTAGKWRRQKRMVAAVAGIVIAFAITGTAYAAVPQFRNFVIALFSEGEPQKFPEKELTEDGDGSSEVSLGRTFEVEVSGKEDSANTAKSQQLGNVHFLQEKRIGKHLAVQYFSLKDNTFLLTQNEKRIVFRQDKGEGRYDYYFFENGKLRKNDRSKHGELKVTFPAPDLTGLYGRQGAKCYENLKIPEISMTIPYDYSEDGYFLDDIFERRSLDDEHELELTAHKYDGQEKYAIIDFMVDFQETSYGHPLIVHMTTGEVIDPFADVDLSKYSCVEHLCLNLEMTKAIAYVGESHEKTHQVVVDLKTHQVLDEGDVNPPVENTILAFPINEEEIYYMTGNTWEDVSGFLYNSKTKETKTVIEHADAGGNQTGDFEGRVYIDSLPSIQNHAMMVYDGVEMEVYLLDVATGEKSVLKGIPLNCGGMLNTFWNGENTIMQMEYAVNETTDRYIFYRKGQKEACYIDCENPKGVNGFSAYWPDETHYVQEFRDEEKGLCYYRIFHYID